MQSTNPHAELRNRRVLILGDSITQEGTYVTFVEYYLASLFQFDRFDIVSIGLSGETVSGLPERQHEFPRPCVHDRLQRALERVRPRVVMACDGMNDGIYHPQSPQRMRALEAGIPAGRAAGV